jgi:hypothetical protein
LLVLLTTNKRFSRGMILLGIVIVLVLGLNV